MTGKERFSISSVNRKYLLVSKDHDPFIQMSFKGKGESPSMFFSCCNRFDDYVFFLQARNIVDFVFLLCAVTVSNLVFSKIIRQIRVVGDLIDFFE